MKPTLMRKFFEKAIEERVLKFFELGYVLEYKEGFVEETEHYVRRSDNVIRFYNDKYIFQFNEEGKTIVVQDANNSQRFYELPTIFITSDLLDAMLEVVVLLEWK